MQNNYTTNNNFYDNKSNFQTHLIRYEKPLYVVLGCSVLDMYGMIIANTHQLDKNGKDNIRTYRIPLIGPQMEPWDAKDEDYTLLILPENKMLDKKLFRRYLNYMEVKCSMDEALNELKLQNFQVDCPEDEIEVLLYEVGDNKIRVNSEWFYFRMDANKDTYFTPGYIGDICVLQYFLKKPFKFKTEDSAISQESVDDLTRLLQKLLKNGFYTSGTTPYVINDGEFTYSTDMGRIPMTRDEFLAKFPKAYNLYKD